MASIMIFFAGMVILFIVCVMNIKKGIHSRNQHWDNFWKQEREASFVTYSHFPSHLLLTLDKDKIPLTTDALCGEAYNQVLRFDNRQMVYLRGTSNVIIKKEYGINYFKQLVTQEETFFCFIDELISYATLLAEKGYTVESTQVLEYSLSFGYDKGKMYDLLIDGYLHIGEPSKLKGLLQPIVASNLSTKMIARLEKRIQTVLN